MKFLIVTVLMIGSLSSFAGVKEDVLALGKLAMGSRSETIKGKTAEEMFENWSQVDRAEFVYKETKDMNDGDEVDVGFTSVKSAIIMGSFAEDHYSENLDQMEDAEVKKVKASIQKLKIGWSPLILNLQKAGVQFAYSSGGPGYCGVTFIQLVIIDVKAQQIHTIHLSAGGPC
jgi:hypothetical protein